MGQKMNPHALRHWNTSDWEPKWIDESQMVDTEDNSKILKELCICFLIIIGIVFVTRKLVNVIISG